jgi:hypothetical protein
MQNVLTLKVHWISKLRLMFIMKLFVVLVNILVTFGVYLTFINLLPCRDIQKVNFRYFPENLNYNGFFMYLSPQVMLFTNLYLQLTSCDTLLWSLVTQI